MKPINSKRGITLMELMLVIAITSVLSLVALPKFLGVGEKAREKIDLLKLYDLRNAINLALIEDSEALSNYSPVKDFDEKKKNDLLKKLSRGLSSDGGASLFVIELHNGLSINVQGSHGSANNANNICEMVGTSGTWYSALKEARFEGVADIIEARLNNNYSMGGATYTSKSYLNSAKKTDYRTAPIHSLFQSKALNFGKKNDNERYTVSVRWSDPDSPGFSVEVYLLPNGHTWQQAFMSDNGTCFSTYGNKGCSKTN